MIDTESCIDLKLPIDLRKSQNGGLIAEVEGQKTSAPSKGIPIKLSYH